MRKHFFTSRSFKHQIDRSKDPEWKFKLIFQKQTNNNIPQKTKKQKTNNILQNTTEKAAKD